MCDLWSRSPACSEKRKLYIFRTGFGRTHRLPSLCPTPLCELYSAVLSWADMRTRCPSVRLRLSKPGTFPAANRSGPVRHVFGSRARSLGYKTAEWRWPNKNYPGEWTVSRTRNKHRTSDQGFQNKCLPNKESRTTFICHISQKISFQHILNKLNINLSK